MIVIWIYKLTIYFTVLSGTHCSMWKQYMFFLCFFHDKQWTSVAWAAQHFPLVAKRDTSSMTRTFKVVPPFHFKTHSNASNNISLKSFTFWHQVFPCVLFWLHENYIALGCKDAAQQSVTGGQDGKDFRERGVFPWRADISWDKGHPDCTKN